MINKNQFYTFREYFKNNELSPSEEDYVEMIYRLKLSCSKVKISSIAKNLNVKIPSASKMIKCLQEKGILYHENYGLVVLSPKGENVGEILYNRHILIEKFLNSIGVEYELHEQTEKIEHTINQDTLMCFFKIDKFFEDYPEILNLYKNYTLKL